MVGALLEYPDLLHLEIITHTGFCFSDDMYLQYLGAVTNAGYVLCDPV